MYSNSIKTLDYGYLEIKYDNTYVKSEVVNTIEDCEGNLYEVKENFNGKLIALLIME